MAEVLEVDTLPKGKAKKPPKVHAYSFSVKTLKGTIPLDDRYKKFKTNFTAETRYSWIMDKDAAWYGGHGGFQIRRVNNLGMAYYWTGGVKKDSIPEWGFAVSTAQFKMPYFGGYYERILILQKKAEWSLGAMLGKGKLKYSYVLDADQSVVKKSDTFKFVELFTNGTIHVTYFFDISGGVGYRFVLNETTPAYQKKWIESPFVTFSVQWSFVKMLLGAVDKNIREVY